MTLIFSGNRFKYQLEAVCKLFLQVENFNFISLDDGTPPATKPVGDYCFICRICGVKNSMLSVFAKIGSSSASEKENVSNDIDDYDDRCEFELSKLLFKCLERLTDRHPEWGVLTGVRPVKLINRLRAKGCDFNGISRYLKEECYVSDKKIRVGYDTAINQDEVIRNIPKRSYSLYVSIPFCPTRCAYCSFISQTVSSFKKLMPEYVKRLREEIEYTARLVNQSGFTLDTVYFGGGTPTSLDAGDLDEIMKTVGSSFDLSNIREYTVEAGRPDTVTADKLAVIKSNGADRISVNPQTVHNSVLEAIGRRHTSEEFFDSYSLAKSIGFKTINVDIIAGLPTDTVDGFKETVESILALQPENYTVHALSIKRASDLMQKYNSSDKSMVGEMISYATDRLYQSGYEPYYLYRQKNQLDNQENIGWTRPGCSGIYNINIMEEIQTIISVGAGATTKIVDGGFERFFNPKYPLEYIKHFDTVLKRKEEAVRLLEGCK